MRVQLRTTWFIGSFVALVVAASFIGTYVLFRPLVTAGWHTEQGRVISSSASAAPKARPSYAPVVEYVVDGTRYQVQSSYWAGQTRPSGSSMRVEFDPGDPSQARVLADVPAFVRLALYLGCLVGAFAVGLFALGAWPARRTRNSTRKGRTA